MSEQDAATTDDAEDVDGQVDTDAVEADAEGDDETHGEEAVFEETPEDLDADVGADLDSMTDELLAEIEDTDDETLARRFAAQRVKIEALEGQLEEAESEVEDLTSRLKRKQADFQNYKKRVEKRREEEKQRATEDLVTRLLDVRDNLKRALEQDADADVREGVEATFRELDRVFDDENVEPVEPEPGDEVDPERHEVLMRVESDQPEDAIADVHRPGYEMAGKVLRTAQVTVSEGASEDDADEEEA